MHHVLRDAVRERVGLAGARAGDDEERWARGVDHAACDSVLDRAALGGIHYIAWYGGKYALYRASDRYD